MSTQIIDNFRLNANLPIDSRIVASGSVARDSIVWKYDGLRVYDTSDHIPYVWIGTTYSGTWSSENLLGVSGNGTASYFALFDSSNVIKSSNIFKSGSYIGINKNNPNYELDVNGFINAGKFLGDGSLITNISASNIVGNLSLSVMPIGSNGFILSTNGSSCFYKNPNTVTVGYSNLSYKSNVVSNSSSDLCNIYFGTQSTFSDSALKYNSNLKFKPSTGQIFIGGGTESNPGLVLGGGTNGGLYYDGSYIGLTIGGDSKIKIAGLGNILAKDGYISGHAPYLISPAFSFMSDSQTGIYRKVAGTIGLVTTGVDRVLISDNGLYAIGGTALLPSISFISDTNTGIYNLSSDTIGITTGGSNRLSISNSGLSVGDGNSFSKILIGRVRVYYNHSSAPSVLYGTGFSISQITPLSSPNIVKFKITPTTSFSTSNLSVLTSVDSDSEGHIPWSIGCFSRSSNRFDISITYPTWTTGYVDISFAAFCIS